MGEFNDIEKLIEKMGRGFEEYKSTNEERLKQIEKNGVPDPATTEKLAKMDEMFSSVEQLKNHLDDIEKKAGRPGQTPTDRLVDEHKQAFDGFMRKGVDDGLTELQEKAVNVGNDDEGGYAVPEYLDSQIEKLATEEVVMRKVCRVMKVSNEGYRKLVSTGGAQSGWVGETSPRPETGTPGLAKLAPTFGEIYANPAATQKSLDDVYFNVQSWLAEEVNEEFAQQEEQAYVSGDGVEKPLGILAHPLSQATDASRPLGTIQYMLSGADAAVDGDNLIDLIHSVKRKYRNKARFMFSGLTLAQIRKLKDADGNYLWRPGLDKGVPGTILQYGYEENDYMPDPGSESDSILFGDFKRAYYILDVRGTRVLRDPFTNKPFVHFYTTRRIGGLLANSEALKILRFGDGA